MTGLLNLRHDWDRLVEIGSGASVFQSFEWISTWRRHCAGGTLLVLVAETDGEIRCIAPLGLTSERFLGLPYRRLRFIGSAPTGTTRRNLFDRAFSIDRRCGWADRLGFLHQTGDTEGVRAVLEHLRRHRQRWDVLDLRELGHRSESIALVREVFGEDSTTCEVGDKSAILSLDGDFESYKHGLGRNWRKNISRTIKRVDTLPDVACVIHSDPADIARMVPKTVELEDRSWQGHARVGVFSHSRNKAFHCEVAPVLAEKGNLLLYTLESAGTLIAHQYALVHNRQLHLYSTAMDSRFSHYSPGFYLVVRVIEDAFAQGIEKIVLGRGPEEYKHKLKTADEDRIWIRVFGAGTVPRLLRSLEFQVRPALKSFVQNRSKAIGADE